MQVGNNPDLPADPSSELKPQFLRVMLNGFHEFILIACCKQADVNFGNRQIGSNMDFGNCYHSAAEQAFAFFLKNIAQVFLKQPGYFMLSCRFHSAKV